MTDVLILETTVGSEDDARILADAVVAECLAACVHIVGPLESVYWWEGAITGAREWLLRCKTTRGRSDALVSRIRELHPYEVPEIVLLEPAGVDDAYAAWVRESVDDGEGAGGLENQAADRWRRTGQASRD
ncbi:MAG: hypothetical protein KatS3mg065_1185 [Chloroflexota bacterium]|nr:MAG: hypothetical protein KatS3mg065_1185 [Chloroflexota bacterium]